jgi:uncharacterized protein DUF4214
MRGLVCGSIILGFAAVLLPWGASELSPHVPAEPQVPSSEIGAKGVGPSAAKAQAIGGHDLEGPRYGITTADPTPNESGKTVARLSSGAVGFIPDTAKRVPSIPAIAVRELPPGSKAHSDVIASIIGSDEFKDTVGPLARLYFAYFDRYPDFEGLDYYIGERERGTPLDSIADEFAGSPEFGIRYGSVDNAAFVDRVYHNVFGAPPDSAQRAYWIGQLDAGMSRGQVMLAFSEGTDFRALTGNEVFVTMAYAEALQRMPDPADFARWVRFLDAGNPRAAVIDGLLATRRTR